MDSTGRKAGPTRTYDRELMRYTAFFLAVCLALVGSACKTTSETPPPNENPPVQMEDGIVGTIKFMDLEGGFYGILGEDGQQYFPINLDETYREDGLRVRFTLRERTDIMTTAMWGKTVEITAIQAL